MRKSVVTQNRPSGVPEKGTLFFAREPSVDQNARKELKKYRHTDKIETGGWL